VIKHVVVHESDESVELPAAVPIKSAVIGDATEHAAVPNHDDDGGDLKVSVDVSLKQYYFSLISVFLLAAGIASATCKA
jgi:hypothetical protein